MNECYLLLITSSTTRAVHLEITADNNAVSLLIALHWFIARKSLPKLIKSGNFKTFKTKLMKAFCRLNGIVRGGLLTAFFTSNAFFKLSLSIA